MDFEEVEEVVQTGKHRESKHGQQKSKVGLMESKELAFNIH